MNTRFTFIYVKEINRKEHRQVSVVQWARTTETSAELALHDAGGLGVYFSKVVVCCLLLYTFAVAA